ncbi:MAG: DUF1376 domain-containing protein [Actinomycetes bacterium]
MEFPIMPLFVRDWSFDVAHLSLEERGAYITLLCEMWGHGGRLPYNKRALSVLLNVGTSSRKREQILSALIGSEPQLIVIENGYLIQRRLLAEFERSQIRKTRAQRGSVGRWGEPDDTEQASDKHGSKHDTSIVQASTLASREHNVSTCLPDAQPMLSLHTKHLAPSKRGNETEDRERESLCPKSPKATPDDLRLAADLKDSILRNNPRATVTDTQVGKWGETFRLMREIDHHSAQEIRTVVEWSQQDDWWWRQILSADAIRRNWNKLTAKMSGSGARRPKIDWEREALNDDL